MPNVISTGKHERETHFVRKRRLRQRSGELQLHLPAGSRCQRGPVPAEERQGHPGLRSRREAVGRGSASPEGPGGERNKGRGKLLLRAFTTKGAIDGHAAGSHAQPSVVIVTPTARHGRGRLPSGFVRLLELEEPVSHPFLCFPCFSSSLLVLPSYLETCWTPSRLRFPPELPSLSCCPPLPWSSGSGVWAPAAPALPSLLGPS